LGTRVIKGFAEPVPVWEVLRSAGHETEETPFVGRQDEIGMLDLAQQRCLGQRTAHLALVVGEPGSGKSRLLGELLKRIGQQHPECRVISLASSPVQATGAISPIGEFARRLCDASDVPHTELRQLIADRLRSAGLTDVDDSARWIAVSTGDDVAGEVSGLADEQVVAAWSKLLRVCLVERPLTVAVDDVQWADEALLRTITRALAIASDAPMFAIMVSRPNIDRDLQEMYAATSHLVRFELLPLGDAEAAHLVDHLLPTTEDSVRAQAIARAGGNPFFLQELARVLAETVSAESAIDLPDTVQSNVVARLDMLPEPARHFLQHAAVIGPVFDVASVTALGSAAEPDDLELLVRRDFLSRREPGPDTFAFRHALIREVAYAQLPRATRARLHEQVARRAIEVDGPVGSAAVDHVVRAATLAPTPERTAKAYQVLRDAAEDARRRGHGLRAQQLMEQASDVAPDAPARLEAMNTAAWLAWGRWHGDEAIRLFFRLADAALDVGDGATECEAVLNATEVAGRYAGTTRRTHEGTELAGWYSRARRRLPAGDARLQAYAQVILCWVNVWTGELDDEPVEEMLRFAAAAGDPRIQSVAMDTATAHGWTMNRLQGAAKIAAQRAEIVEHLTDPLTVGIERSDTLIMAADTQLTVGNLPAFKRAAQAIYEFEAPRGNLVVALTRLAHAAYFEARWDDMFALVEQLHTGWIEAGRPTAVYAVPSVWAAAAVARLRGDPQAEARWSSFAEQVGAASPRTMVWQAIHLAEADLHLGHAQEALGRLDAANAGPYGELRPLLAAGRAEAAVMLGVTDAGEIVGLAAEAAAQNNLAAAVVRRAAAVLHDDPDELAAVAEEFRAIDAVYQKARTEYLLGREARRRASALFEQLRIPEPRPIQPSVTA
jgi:hypothetical protein